MQSHALHRAVALTCIFAALVGGLFVTGCGNPQVAATSTPGAAPSATEPAATPTLRAAPSAVGAIPAPGIPVTPVAVTPVSAASLRPDCPQAWMATSAPQISVCYPSDTAVTRGEKPGYVAYNVVTSAAATTADHAIFLAIGLEGTPSIAAGTGCSGASPLYSAEGFEQQDLELPVGNVTACLASGSDGSQPARSIMFSLPVANQFLNVVAVYRGDDTGNDHAQVQSILTSLRLPS